MKALLGACQALCNLAKVGLCVRWLSVVCRFIVTIPPGYPMEAAGPVFCAGITMYSPLVDWKVRGLSARGGGDVECEGGDEDCDWYIY